MRLYLDCEFTDFIECDLISIALVSDDGREFYGERSDYDDAGCSAFVREAVLPQLGQHPGRVFTREALRTALLAWLAQFASESERIFCMDYGGDWDLLLDLVGELPDGWQAQQVNALLDPARMEAYYREHGGRHHALHDAHANRYAADGYSEEGGKRNSVPRFTAPGVQRERCDGDFAFVRDQASRLKVLSARHRNLTSHHSCCSTCW